MPRRIPVHSLLAGLLLAGSLTACGDDDVAPDPADAAGGDAARPPSGDAGDPPAPDAGAVDATAPPVDSTVPPPPDMTFVESGGLVVIEAENYHDNDDNGTPRAWYLTTPAMTPDVPGRDDDGNHADSASGMAYLEGLPDTRVTHDDPLVNGESFFNDGGQGPTLRYRVRFTQTGRYYVWVRAYSTGTEDNGCHVGIDGTWPDSGRRVQWCSGKNAWTWSNAKRDSGGSACGVDGTIWIDVDTPGEHTVELSMREDGFEMDKIILVLDEAYTPMGAGPEQTL